MKEKKTNSFSLKGVCIIIFITAIVTSLTTGLIIYNNSKIVLGSASIKDDDALREFLKVYNGLKEDYYEDIDRSKMIDVAIAAMLNYLGEDYSTYMDQYETDNLADRLSGKFDGIGISINNGREIVDVYKDTPAYRSGLQSGDILVMINGSSTEGLTQSQVANLINKNGENELVIQRNEENMTFHVKAEKINTPLTHELIEWENHKIGYIEIESFTNTVGEEFKKSLQDLEEQDMESLMIDMRNNSGGYLKGATEIAKLFLKPGMTMYSLESKEKTEKFEDDTEEHRDYDVAILVNENSASASEVLTAALKDNLNHVFVVGNTTFGKGKVQQTKSLEDGSMVKYTTARWLRPNGSCIDGVGITPDYEIDLEQNEEGIWVDTQFNKALELLS